MADRTVQLTRLKTLAETQALLTVESDADAEEREIQLLEAIEELDELSGHPNRCHLAATAE